MRILRFPGPRVGATTDGPIGASETNREPVADRQERTPERWGEQRDPEPPRGGPEALRWIKPLRRKGAFFVSLGCRAAIVALTDHKTGFRLLHAPWCVSFYYDIGGEILWASRMCVFSDSSHRIHGAFSTVPCSRVGPARRSARVGKPLSLSARRSNGSVRDGLHLGSGLEALTRHSL